MNRTGGRRAIIFLTCAFYALQVALLVYWHSLAPSDARAEDALVSLAIATTLGIIDLSVAHYLLQALHRSETVYAADVSKRLKHSLESYHLSAIRDEELAREVGHAVEEELARAREALTRGKASTAEEHIRASLAIASQSCSPCCENAAVAAVLESKARQCNDAGVGFDAKVDIPQHLSLPDVEVAAILFNLIDNALRECEVFASKRPDIEPVLTVRSKVQASQLFIEVTNPIRPKPDEKRRGRYRIGQIAEERRAATTNEHGWGTSIVSTIARDHGGLAEFDVHGGSFVASVMIPLASIVEKQQSQ